MKFIWSDQHDIPLEYCRIIPPTAGEIAAGGLKIKYILYAYNK